MCAKCLLDIFHMALGYVSGFLNTRPLSDPNLGHIANIRSLDIETLELADFIEMDPLPYIGHEVTMKFLLVFLTKNIFTPIHAKM